MTPSRTLALLVCALAPLTAFAMPKAVEPPDMGKIKVDLIPAYRSTLSPAPDEAGSAPAPVAPTAPDGPATSSDNADGRPLIPTAPSSPRAEEAAAPPSAFIEPTTPMAAVPGVPVKGYRTMADAAADGVDPFASAEAAKDTPALPPLAAPPAPSLGSSYLQQIRVVLQNYGLQILGGLALLVSISFVRSFLKDRRLQRYLEPGKATAPNNAATPGARFSALLASARNKHD